MHRHAALRTLATAAALTLASACHPDASTATPSTSPTPTPSPTYSGPAWDAYQAGQAFGRANQDTARIPASDAAQNPDGTAFGAVAADQKNASRWCSSHLPKDLGATHRSYLKALVGGCMDGVLPDYLSPKNPSLYF
ncbi:hypothetical protein [Streptomyces sp. R33]|uniref:Uncharacterized protein n=1 Tax=Streptomyces sp. R33 TaxID=3238629 RepID=A0AB39YIZ6_9ACTN